MVPVAVTALALSVDVAASVSDKLVFLAFPVGALAAARRTDRAGMNTRSAAWMVGLRQAQEGF